MHGMKWNPEVGMWNSELKEKEYFTIHNFPFRIPKSSFTRYSKRGEAPKFCFIQRRLK